MRLGVIWCHFQQLLEILDGALQITACIPRDTAISIRQSKQRVNLDCFCVVFNRAFEVTLPVPGHSAVKVRPGITGLDFN